MRELGVLHPKPLKMPTLREGQVRRMRGCSCFWLQRRKWKAPAGSGTDSPTLLRLSQVGYLCTPLKADVHLAGETLFRANAVGKPLQPPSPPQRLVFAGEKNSESLDR